jgi:hypothetical protein
VAIELAAPSIVTGDGRATLRALVASRRNARGVDDEPVLGWLARYCGIASVEQVVPAGREVVIEYRYGSRYETMPRRNANALASLRGTALGAQFLDACAAAAAAVTDGGGDALFTLDAVVDARGQAWFLEMNCNPLVHPDAYAAMVRARYGAAGEEPAARPAADVRSATAA